MEVKVFKFCLNDCGKNYKKEHDRPLNAWETEDIEKEINKRCKGKKIISMTVNTYTTDRHNNGDTDEVYALYTVVVE